VTASLEDQVVVLAPTGRDAKLTCDILLNAGLPARSCASISEVIEHVHGHCGALLLAEEALTPSALQLLEPALDAQPPWSDIPLLVLAGSEFSNSATRPLNVLGPLRNVLILERPVRRLIFIRAVEVAMRSRRRQFEMRAHLQARADVLRREQELNRLKDEFLMTVSHELRTPLTAIVGWSRMLATGEIRESQRDRALDIIVRNASAQAQLVSDLLDVSRAISGKTRLNIQPVDVRTAVSGAVDTVAPAARAKRTNLRVDLGNAAAPVLADPDRLQQVVWNLLSNAIKFTPEEGQVDVRVECVEPWIDLTVRDSGVGIPPHFLPHVFDSFRQGEGGTTRQTGGLGLGLAIVRHLVELHGGTVEASSAGVGKGSSFRVRLPIAVQTGASERPRPSAGSAEAVPAERLDGRRILIVDDDQDALELFSEILTSAGADVRSANSIGSALKIAAAFDPDVVLSDIEMPITDGYALVTLLRERIGQSPVAIAVTAHAREEDKQRALQAGFSAHIAKPLLPSELIETVARASIR
jgi:signal transduction histidine kinase/CheY-like chemotaxis protein